MKLNSKETMLATTKHGAAAFTVAMLFAVLTGCAGTPRSESTGQALDDTAITTKVKTDLLKATGIHSADIHVDTFRGTVLLSGFVPSSDEKRRATEIASSVSGVRNVEDKLVVKGAQ